MLKSSAIKVFATFAFLLLLQGVLLLLIFTQSSMKDTENSVYDLLLRRSQLVATKMTLELKAGAHFHASQTKLETLLFSPTRGIQGPNPQRIDSASFASQFESLPKEAFVTKCSGLNGLELYCGFAPIQGSEFFVLESMPKSNLIEVLKNQLGKILPSFALLLLIALIAAWIISYLLQRPLRKITQVARLVAEGQLNSAGLPIHRTDEIGELAKAFSLMIENLRDREKHLTKAGLKLAHQARLASVGQMGASIAHEVKNPLTSMMGYAKHLAAKTEDPQLKEAAEIIQKEADRCSQILTQMLRFSRNDNQEHKPYSLKEVVESTLLLIKSELKAAQMKIRVTYKEEPIVVGHAQQMQQVLLNLLMNAIHACKPILMTKPEAAEISVEVYEEDNRVRVRIEDRGPGMSRETQLRLFEPFFTTKEKGSGTGLGLSVALDLLQSQGGNLHFESQEGRGSIFWIDLPNTQQLMNRTQES